MSVMADTDFEAEKAFHIQRLRDHQPGPFGDCPICGGEGRCGPRRESADWLMDAGVDLSGNVTPHETPAPLRLADAVVQIYIDEWREHRDHDPPCHDAADAQAHLIACGIDPNEVT